MHEINREIGLEAMIRGNSVSEPKHEHIDEKDGVKFEEGESPSL